MSKTPGPASEPPGKSAAEKKPVAQATGAAADKAPSAKGARARSNATAKGVPNPYDPEFERPLSELPPLTFPNTSEYEFRLAADRQRRSRIRNETIFGAGLLVAGLVVLAVGHTPAVLALAAIAAAAMAAYELIISGIE